MVRARVTPNEYRTIESAAKAQNSHFLKLGTTKVWGETESEKVRFLAKKNSRGQKATAGRVNSFSSSHLLRGNHAAPSKIPLSGIAIA
jgi:hypothetical protein